MLRGNSQLRWTSGQLSSSSTSFDRSQRFLNVSPNTTLRLPTGQHPSSECRANCLRFASDLPRSPLARTAFGGAFHPIRRSSPSLQVPLAPPSRLSLAVDHSLNWQFAQVISDHPNSMTNLPQQSKPTSRAADALSKPSLAICKCYGTILLFKLSSINITSICRIRPDCK